MSADGYESEAPVGRFPKGAARWGQLDMAGNLREWTIAKTPDDMPAEWNVTMGSSCGGSHDVRRSAFASEWAFPCSEPGGVNALATLEDDGFRCAADPRAQGPSDR